MLVSIEPEMELALHDAKGNCSSELSDGNELGNREW